MYCAVGLKGCGYGFYIRKEAIEQYCLDDRLKDKAPTLFFAFTFETVQSLSLISFSRSHVWSIKSRSLFILEFGSLHAGNE